MSKENWVVALIVFIVIIVVLIIDPWEDDLVVMPPDNHELHFTNYMFIGGDRYESIHKDAGKATLTKGDSILTAWYIHDGDSFRLVHFADECMGE